MDNTTKDISEFSLTELCIQQMLRKMDLSGLMYQWDQTNGPGNVEVSASYYSDDMSMDEQALSGHLSQYIKDQGYDKINANHALLVRLNDENILEIDRYMI